MTQQNLVGPKISCRLVDQRRLCSTHRMCTIFSLVEPNRRDPFVDKSRILACAEMPQTINPAWKQEVESCAVTTPKPSLQALSSLRHDLKLHWPASLLLDHVARLRIWPPLTTSPILILTRSQPRTLLSMTKSKSARSRSRRCSSRLKRIAQKSRGFNGRLGPTVCPAFHGRCP